MKYRISYEVDRVVGTQHYLVEAKNEKQALEKHAKGESEWECDELEIQSFKGRPEVKEA